MRRRTASSHTPASLVFLLGLTMGAAVPLFLLAAG